MRFEIVKVTRPLADQWLAMNTRNRKVRPSHVKALANAMRRGEFVPTHQPIAINGTTLIDGQHRLLGFLASGLREIDLPVMFDVSSTSFDVVDTGIRRTMSDSCLADPQVMQPIHMMTQYAFNRRVTARQQYPIYEAVRPLAEKVVSAIPRNVKKFTTAPVRAGVMTAIMAGQDEQKTLALYKEAANLNVENLPPSIAVLAKNIAMDKYRPGDRIPTWAKTYVAFCSENFHFQRVLLKQNTARYDEVVRIFSDYLTRLGVHP